MNEIQVWCFEMKLMEDIQVPPHLNPLPPGERKKEDRTLPSGKIW